MGHGRDGLAGESVSLDTLSGPFLSHPLLPDHHELSGHALQLSPAMVFYFTTAKKQWSQLTTGWNLGNHESKSVFPPFKNSFSGILSRQWEGRLTDVPPQGTDSFTLPQCIPIYFLLTKLVPEQVKLFTSVGAFVCFTSFISFVLAKVEAILLSRKPGIHCLVSLNYTITMGFPMWYTCIYWSRLFKRL